MLDIISGNIVLSISPFIDKTFLEKAVTTFEKAIDNYGNQCIATVRFKIANCDYSMLTLYS